MTDQIYNAAPICPKCQVSHRDECMNTTHPILSAEHIKGPVDLPLSASQRQFGEKQIIFAADRWGVTPVQAAKIMMDIAYIKDAWNWVNMDTFLDNYTAQ